jgi:hypothetical protein
LQFAQANAQTKNCKRACFANADKIVFKKSPTLKKNKNTSAYSPSMMQKLNIDKTYSNMVDRGL